SYMCRVQGVNIVINIFYAIAVNAAYAISITVLNAINTLTQSLITALRPQIFKSYGECDLKRYNHLVLFGSKYTFSILFLLSSPVILCADELLKIWLDIVPDYTVEFVRLVIVVAFIDSFSYSMIAGIQATGRIKTYQLVVSLIVLINLPLTFILFKAGNNVLSMFYPFIVTAIINQGLRLYFIYINAGFDYKKYFTVVIYPCLLAVCLSLVTDISIKKMLPFNSIIDVLIVCIFIFSFNTIIFYWVVVSKKEKKWLLETLKRKVK
ncbi:O124 family O-antigen flippase, partial [Shigella dysenteriae]